MQQNLVQKLDMFCMYETSKGKQKHDHFLAVGYCIYEVVFAFSTGTPNRSDVRKNIPTFHW